MAAVYAESEAEADPAYLNAYLNDGYYGYPYAYAQYGFAGHGYNGYSFLKSAPCVNAANQPVPCRHRRDAEADPSFYYATYKYPYGLVHSSHFGICYNYLGARVPC